jgi:serine/threonine protein kinase
MINTTDFELSCLATKMTADDFFSQLPEADRTPENYIELVRVELYYRGWPESDIDQTLARLVELSPSQHREFQRSLVTSIYQDQIAAKHPISLDVIEQWASKIGPLDLRVEEDSFGLGETIDGRFRIIRRLSAGAWGTVYLAQDLSSNELVAVKSIKRFKNLARKKTALNRLALEAKIAESIDHLRIPRLVAWIPEGKSPPALVMQYVPGETLRHRLRKGVLDPEQAAVVIAQVANAADHAHARAQVTHRDLKPENIILHDNGDAYLCDFGLAVTLDGQFLEERLIVGTANYQSSDVILALNNEVDPRADVWALGAILFECLAGKPPGEGGSKEDQLVEAILAAKFSGELPDSVPEPIQAICRKCLEPNPLHRFNSCRDLVTAIEDFLGEPVISQERLQTTPWDRSADLLAFRMGLKLADIQRNIEIFDSLCPTGTPRKEDKASTGYALMGIFAMSEATQDLEKIAPPGVLSKGPPAEEARKLFYAASRITAAQLDQAGFAVASYRSWCETTMDQLLKYLSDQVIPVRACFELGFVAGLTRSPKSRSIELQRIAPLAQLPDRLWKPLAEAVQNKCEPAQLEPTFLEFEKRVERYLQYGPSATREETEP